MRTTPFLGVPRRAVGIPRQFYAYRPLEEASRVTLYAFGAALYACKESWTR